MAKLLHGFSEVYKGTWLLLLRDLTVQCSARAQGEKLLGNHVRISVTSSYKRLLNATWQLSVDRIVT